MTNSLKIKICGLNNFNNMKEVENLKPDFIGLIFYKSSPRYIYNSDDVSQIKEFISTPKVGVFVNEELSSINKKISEFKRK